MRRIANAYGYLSPDVIPVEDVHPEPPQTQERVAMLNKPTPTDKVSIGYHGPALGDRDHAPLSLLADILFGGRASRVHRALVQEAEIATDIRGWVGSFRDPGLFEMNLIARPGRTSQELIEALDRQLQLVLADPVQEEELERAKARAELGLIRGLETCAGKAEQIAFFATVLDDPAGAFRRLQQIRGTDRTDVLRVARRYLSASSRTVIAVHPTADSKQEAK
jgi:zinc protease